ncbi:hypothetical protein [Paraburkholderia sediminicola]|uniref:hypothetical protein n=1 Tax=Paraburkholderia sediminicola TaxID=458836 RepID=UPI0038B6F7C0
MSDCIERFFEPLFAAVQQGSRIVLLMHKRTRQRSQPAFAMQSAPDLLSDVSVRTQIISI